MTATDPWNADYSKLDSVLFAWAQEKGIHVDLEAKGYPFRSFWVRNGSKLAQVWIDPPDVVGDAKLHAAELDAQRAGGWGQRLDSTVSADNLRFNLDKVFSTVCDWARHQLRTSLQRELWTSWASMLRVYAAAHGLGSEHHAVVEVGAEEIVLRVDTRWARFTHDAMTTSDGVSVGFGMEEDGRVRIGDTMEEMDLAAERVAREMLTRSDT